MIHVADLLEDSGGEIDAELDVLLRELARDLPAKVDGYRRIMAHFDGRAASRKAEAKRLADLAAQDERAHNRLRDRLKESLELAGERKIVTDLFSVSICRNGTPSVVWEGAIMDVPAAFKRIIEEVDTMAAIEHLRAHGELPNGFSWHYGTHLRLG